MMFSSHLEKILILVFFSSLSHATLYSCDRRRVCGCGYYPVNIIDGIINSQSVIPYSWSMVVSIRYGLYNENTYRHVCSGTILSDSHILTAANCFQHIRDDVQSMNVIIATGIHQQSQARQIICRVDQILFHPNWTDSSNNHEHDIALLHLSEPLDFQASVRISRTCLPPKIETNDAILRHPNNNQTLVMIGWDGTDEADVLKQIPIQSIDYGIPDCKYTISNPFDDIGGPIFQWNEDHWEQVGITSLVTNHCNQGFPIGYTRVAYYRDWIESNMVKFTQLTKELSLSSNTVQDPPTERNTTTLYECDIHAVPCGCSILNVQFDQSRIINGTPAISYSWSMVVSIHFNGSDKRACAGTILGESHILTSASCVAHIPIFDMFIVAGAYAYTRSETNRRKVDSVFIHPYYADSDSGYINDIAILHLSSPLDLENDLFIVRTCLSGLVEALPDPTDYPAAEALLAVVGWGYTDYENRTDPDALQQAEVYVAYHSNENCHISDMHQNIRFCAGVEQGDKVPCTGDLGSPIFQWYGNRWQQVGLASSANECDQSKALGIYTRLVMYYDWIVSIVNGSTPSIDATTTTETTVSRNPPEFYHCDRTLTCGCGLTPVVLTPTRIVGGEEAFEYSWPMMVSLRILGNDKHACGATILSNSYILTAAHCLSGYQSGVVTDMAIATGMTNLIDSKGIRRSVDRVYIHPNYRGSDDSERHDIALLHLNQPIPTKSYPFVTKTCINRVVSPVLNSQYIKNGTRLTVIGWGTTKFGTIFTPNVLRQTEIYAIDNNHPTCNSTIGDVEVQFCAGLYEGGKDSCRGDSGGPIFQWTGQYWEQVGIVSYGQGCGDVGYPGVYTRLSYYYDWINDILSKNNEHIEPGFSVSSTTSMSPNTIPTSTGNYKVNQYQLTVLIVSILSFSLMIKMMQ